MYRVTGEAKYQEYAWAIAQVNSSTDWKGLKEVHLLKHDKP